jgi:hypothetical protein
LAREAQCLDEYRDQMVTRVHMAAENQGYGPGGGLVEPSTAYHEDLRQHSDLLHAMMRVESSV